MNISALLCIHQDIEYLPLVLEQICDTVDEIVIVDGPYRWLTDFFKDLPLNHGSQLPELNFRGLPILQHAKIKYFHRIWIDEIEKRTFGYQACFSEVVMVIDSDEIFELDRNRIEEYLNSPAVIGRIEIFSLARTFARSEYPVTSLEWALNHVNDPHQVNRFFKKAHISAADHIPYLQLLNLPQELALTSNNRAPEYDIPLGRMMHLCVMRTGIGNLTKYLFYIVSFHLAQGNQDPILRAGGWETYSDMLREITIDEYCSILLHVSPDSIRCPKNRVITPFSLMPEAIASQIRYSDTPEDEYGITFKRPRALLNHFSSHFYLPTSAARGCECRITLENITYLNLSECRFFYSSDNTDCYHQIYSGPVVNNSVTVQLEPIESSKERPLFAQLISILGGTPDGRSVGWIKSIELI